MAEIDKTATALTRNKIKTQPSIATSTTTTKKSLNATHTKTLTPKAPTGANIKRPAHLPDTKVKSIIGSSNSKLPPTSSHVTNVRKTTTKTLPPKKPIATKTTVPKRPATEFQKAVPMRSKDSSKPATKRAEKTNVVLNTPHNVTVTTPPMPRKNDQLMNEEPEEKLVTAKAEPKKKVLRTGSRTLEPDEIVILRRESAKERFEESAQASLEQSTTKSCILPAVAFDVNFNDSQSHNQKECLKVESDNEYSDDCESSFSSCSTAESSSMEPKSQQVDDNDDDDESDRHISNNSDTEEEESNPFEDENNLEEDDDESQVTPYPSTVIFKEQKLDSGNYEINTSKQNARMPELDHSSLDTISAARSDHFDSGTSSYSNYALHTKQQALGKWASCSSGYIEFFNKPIINFRGRDLMTKIRKFDEVTFGIFELKPISYDVYMQSYGNLNTMQSYTQTFKDDQISRDVQTDDYSERNMWTQHPPLFDRQSGENLVCDTCSTAPTPHSTMYKTLLLPTLQHNRSQRKIASKQLLSTHKPFTYDKLNAFLLKSSLVLEQIFEAVKSVSTENVLNRESIISSNVGLYQRLNTQVLNALQVVRVFANSRHNMIITVHETLPDVEVYRADFSNLLMVWSVSNYIDNKPIRLLSTWSEVCRVEICYDCPDVVVCGLRDGSVALWNLLESHSYCSKLDGCLTHFAATHSIVPKYSITDKFTKERKFLDFGATVDVKSFRSSEPVTSALAGQIARKCIQFVSLHDNGLLTIWTLVKNNANCGIFTADTSEWSKKSKSQPNFAKSDSPLEFSSPWAQIKLIQSNTCDLRSYMEYGSHNPKSQFANTQTLFQLNLSNANARLQIAAIDSELTSTGSMTTNLRFTALDVGEERIYVCSNRNFVLSCPRSLKWDRINRIVINESRSLFLTAIRVMNNENLLAVGLANGAVIIVNCSPQLETSNTDNKQKDAKYSHNSNLSKQKHDMMQVIPDNGFYPEMTKSCAIQNIILNEKRASAYNIQSNLECYSSRPVTAQNNSAKYNKRKAPPTRERRICDQLLVLSGSDLRENLVQSIEVCRDGEQLFVLSNKHMRAYNFTLNTELACDMNTVCDFTITRTGIVTLNAQNYIDVYHLK